MHATMKNSRVGVIQKLDQVQAKRLEMKTFQQHEGEYYEREK